MKSDVSFLCVVATLALTLAGVTATRTRSFEPLAAPLESISRQIDGRVALTDGRLDSEVLRVLLPTNYLLRTYRGAGSDLGLFIAYYADQRAGESMHSPKNCLPGSGWEVWDSADVEIPLAPKSVTVTRYAVQNGSARMQVLYWYQTRERLFSNEYIGKFLLVKDAMLNRTRSGSLVRITVEDRPDAVHDSIAFASRIIPEIQVILGK